MAYEALFAFIAAFALLFVFFFLATYIYSAVVLMVIAKKTNTPNGWLAWIPIANMYLMTQISETPWWTMFAFLLPIVPIVGGLGLMAVLILWWWKIAERRKHPGWFSILMLLPIINFVIMGIIAWKD